MFLSFITLVNVSSFLLLAISIIFVKNKLITSLRIDQNITSIQESCDDYFSEPFGRPVSESANEF